MEPEGFKRFEFQYGVILIRTRRFQSLMDRLGANRISKPVGWFLLYILPVAAAVGFYLFLSELGILLSPRGAAVADLVRHLGPLSYLGLPGINPYLPIVDGWIALVVAMVIHEGAHGITARSLGLPVKASGLLLFLFVPIGAFVDVDEEALRNARASHSGRVLAAGAGVNLVAGLISLLILVALVGGMTPAAKGVPITQVNVPSPASKAGILPGDFILAVNGIQYTDGSQIQNSTWYAPGNVVNVTIWRQGEVRDVQLTVGARPDTTLACSYPMAVGVPGTCTAVLSGYLGDVSGESFYFSSNGTGAFSSTTCSISGGSCSVEFTPSTTLGSPQNITAVYNGDASNMYSSASDLVQVSPTPAAGQNGVTKAEGPASPLGYLGTGSQSDSALSDLVSGYTSVLKNPLQYVCIPTFPQCQPRVPFSDAMGVFYTSPLGPATTPLANLAYWFFFLNFNLAIFNALPIYPLDGGQAFSVGVKALGRGRLSEKQQTMVVRGVTMLVVGLILAVLAGPYLL